MTLTFNTHRYSIRCLFQLTFRPLAAIVSEKSTVFTFSYRKALVTKFDPCRKIGQGQPRVIIYINFVELESPILHAKFQDHRTSGSGEEDFLRFLLYMGMAATLVM